MRILHTADWHLGRVFCGANLLNDQAHVLDEFVCLAHDIRPDAILISGDIYDRALPPPDAVHLLDEILTRLVVDQKRRVVLIAGNHDSPERLNFGSRLLNQSGLHLVGQLSPEPAVLTFTDTHGPVYVGAIPYAEPAVARERLSDSSLTDHAATLHVLVERARKAIPANDRSVLMAHAFVAGCAESESERPLTVGGTGAVPPALFEGFHYTALGHLHRPQALLDGRIQYSGSLLKYSFSEVTHTKSVTLVEIDGKGEVQSERIPLHPQRDVRWIEGHFDGLMRSEVSDGREDYLAITLLDRGLVLDAMTRLRTRYPNLLQLTLPETARPQDRGGVVVDHRRLGEREIFEAFVREVTGNVATTEELSSYSDVVEAMHAREREAST